MDVNIDKGGHQELTVESVHDSSMSRDQVSKIFDLECSLKSRCKETTKRTDDRSEERHEEAVDEEGVEGDGGFHTKDPAPSGDGIWQAILLGSEES